MYEIKLQPFISKTFQWDPLSGRVTRFINIIISINICRGIIIRRARNCRTVFYFGSFVTVGPDTIAAIVSFITVGTASATAILSFDTVREASAAAILSFDTVGAASAAANLSFDTVGTAYAAAILSFDTVGTATAAAVFLSIVQPDTTSFRNIYQSYNMFGSEASRFAFLSLTNVTLRMSSGSI